ncbi:MAG TPA: AIR synthase-related protein, partial [Pseudomonadales bacterium]|nr:AIR synthase-related protein [Pseudomonadales bacterium]
TDVTGFGLAGHLSEMLAASGCRATLDLDKVPILAGALEALSAGVTSTLHEGNRRSVPGVAYADHPTFEIMFDPQTAGGLLVGVAADRAESLAAELRATGYGDANIIGRVHSAGTPGIAFAPY